MAFAVMDVLRGELRLKIPADISVAGYDDVPEVGWGGYSLTTVRQPGEAMVDATVAIMLEQVEKRVVDRRVARLPSQLIVRASTRPPR